METRLNPVHRLGKKNIACPYYGHCLDYAAKHSWQYWDCVDCSHKLTKQPVQVSAGAFDDSELYYEMPRNVYKRLMGRYGEAF